MISRNETPNWYPRSCNLALPDVPAESRAEIRRILGWLGELPIRPGSCWYTGQMVALLSRDSRVQYVEGVSWIVKNTDPIEPMFRDDLVSRPLPHAWNVINGYPVDLLAEFYRWRGLPGIWLHEGLKIYTSEDIRAQGDPENSSLYQKQWMREHDPEHDMAAICEQVFKHACDALAVRLS